jgi:cell wall-associated NlpC family hydrolase
MKIVAQLFLISLLFLALLPSEIDCIGRRLELELQLNPAYAWGAAGLEPGAVGDCSGKLFAICFSCGVPLQRTTAARMAEGQDGWDFPIVSIERVKALALVHMTTQEHRPLGHVGMLTDSDHVAHASSKGFVETEIGRLRTTIRRFRQINWQPISERW